MNKIVFLGSSAATAQAMESIRDVDRECQLTLIPFDGRYPYRRDLFIDWLAKEAGKGEMACREEGFYERFDVDMSCDKKVTKVNIKKKKIYLEDRKQIDFDILVIGDTPNIKFPDIKGTNKNGVHNLIKFEDAEKIVNAIPLVDMVAVQSDSFEGIKLALAILSRGKEVLLITSDRLLADALDEEDSRAVAEQLESAGLRVVTQNAVQEILGDADAKAIRLMSGKVLAAQMIIFPETDPDLKVFGDALHVQSGRLAVDEHYRTNVEYVYAFDYVCVQNNEEEPARTGPFYHDPVLQGKKVATAVTGGAETVSPDLKHLSAKYSDLHIQVIGQTYTGEGVIERKVRDTETGRYGKIFIMDGRLVGAVLINLDAQTDIIKRFIAERTDIGGREDEILGRVDESVLAIHASSTSPADEQSAALEDEGSPVDSTTTKDSSPKEGEMPLNPKE